jgi:hypothetical protein
MLTGSVHPGRIKICRVPEGDGIVLQKQLSQFLL